MQVELTFQNEETDMKQIHNLDGARSYGEKYSGARKTRRVQSKSEEEVFVILYEVVWDISLIRNSEGAMEVGRRKAPNLEHAWHG